MKKIFLTFLTTTALSIAGTPLANVSSDAPFALDGKTIAVRGVMSWPVLSGDKISTITAPALISFRDGSTISLAANSTLRILGSDAKPVAVLENGALDYDIVKNSTLSVSQLSDSGKSTALKTSISRAAVGTVVATSLAGAATAAVRLSAGGAGTTATAATPLALRPPPLSRFQ